MSYPQFLLRNRYFAWLSPPPLGRVLVLACYWAMITFMMTNGAIIKDVYYYERIGFRNAWISVTQVPLVYLLASKSSIIGYIIGSSHERLNWLHRWVSRTLLITVTVHGGFFIREWMKADFVLLELEMMPVVKYGMGAWGVLVWTFITSLSPLRSMAYQVFVLQHIVAAAVLLWLLSVHVPSYAIYNIWFAIGAVSFDWVLRLCMGFYRNIRIRRGSSCSCTKRIGHQVDVRASGSDISIITVRDMHLSWKPGQHVYLWVPALGPLEMHPFTIATPRQKSEGHHCNVIQLAIKAQSGFSRRLYRYAIKTQGILNSSLTGFILGPYGLPPQWDAYETLILISASTGASFTLPILESILEGKKTVCTQRIKFLFAVRQRNHIEFYTKRLSEALAQAQVVGIDLHVEIAVTGDEASLADDEKVVPVPENSDVDISKNAMIVVEESKDAQYPVGFVKSLSMSTSTSSSSRGSLEKEYGYESGLGNSIKTSDSIKYSYGRPDIDSFLRNPVEETGGETAVAVCGGKPLVARVRNSVASLSDERAVHKGTRAQGIFLHVEEYCF
jgi:NAD(P)H-flavin reductase